MKDNILLFSKNPTLTDFIIYEVRHYKCPCCGRQFSDDSCGYGFDSVESLIEALDRIPVPYEFGKLSIEDNELSVEIHYTVPEEEFDDELEPVCKVCKEVNIELNLDDYTKEQLLKISAEREVTPTELIESFIADLTWNDKTNGSDERMHAEEWLNRVIWK